ncbi:MAG: IS630 family transposase [Gammaproteobacteria bacterium]|nr:IS630 family transposase [Gammaproteobacteria bacterium]
MPQPIRPLPLTPEQRRALEAVAGRPTAARRDCQRARAVLCRADGLSQSRTAAEVGLSRASVVKWERRFRESGTAGLADAGGRGRKPSIAPEVRERIIVGATRPPPNRGRWSARSMAKAAGVSKATVQRLWSANGIKPHLTRTFKLSGDKDFEAKFWDVVGLYLKPPDRALVLCCDEKSQCQALERSQPGFPVLRGHSRTQTHDCRRHGTVTLFAAMAYLDGKVFSRTAARHTHREWLDFLRQLNGEAPEGVSLHLIADNYATHKHAKVRSWIRWRNQRHRKAHGIDRIVMHFTPTSSSWMNLVERFFRDLTQDVIRDGSFASVGDLVAAINAHIEEHNLNPKPYVWRKSGQEILAKIQRAREAHEKAQRMVNEI